MDRVAFEIFGIEIMWYSIIIVFGLIIGMTASYNIYKREVNFDKDVFFNMFAIAVLLGIIGARLYYVLFIGREYDSILEIFNTREGGLAFHGGVLLGGISVIVYLLIKKVKVLLYLDMLVFTVIIGQAFGRWGNFVNQEAHGSEVSKAFIEKFPNFIEEGMYIGGRYYHPTFLYESISNFILVAVLIILLLKFNKKLFYGSVMIIALTWNSFMRIFIESLRTDSLYFGSFRVPQIISIMIIILMMSLLVIINKKLKTYYLMK